MAIVSRAGRLSRDRSKASVPAGTRVYAIGDSHGCADRLEALHDAIMEDSAQAETGAETGAGRRVVVYLGDYVDRGANSRALLDLLIERPLAGFESVHIMGNHDEFLANFLNGTGDLGLWLYNGGDATLRSYGVDPATIYGNAPQIHGELLDRVPDRHIDFLNGLRPSHVEGDYLFVHAGIRPGVPLEDQDPKELRWIREPFLSWPDSHGKVVVHGHTPTREPAVRANRIGIDTGAVYGGPLTALVLEGAERRFLQV